MEFDEFYESYKLRGRCFKSQGRSFDTKCLDDQNDAERIEKESLLELYKTLIEGGVEITHANVVGYIESFRVGVKSGRVLERVLEENSDNRQPPRTPFSEL